MPRIQIITTLIATSLISAPSFSGMTLPVPPTDDGQKINVAGIKPRSITLFNVLAYNAALAGTHTLATLYGDSGTLGNDISFFKNDSNNAASIFLRQTGFILDLVQPDDMNRHG